MIHFSIAQGTTSISAEFEGVSSPGVNREVSPATLESIAIVPANPTVPLAARTLQFKAMGTFSDMNVVDITESTTWIPGNGEKIQSNKAQRGINKFGMTSTECGMATMRNVK